MAATANLDGNIDEIRDEIKPTHRTNGKADEKGQQQRGGTPNAASTTGQTVGRVGTIKEMLEKSSSEDLDAAEASADKGGDGHLLDLVIEEKMKRFAGRRADEQKKARARERLDTLRAQLEKGRGLREEKEALERELEDRFAELAAAEEAVLEAKDRLAEMERSHDVPTEAELEALVSDVEEAEAAMRPVPRSGSTQFDVLELDSKVAEELECPVCLEEMRPPTRQIFSCSNAHLFCGRCRARGLKVCPKCREPFAGRGGRAPARNRLAERWACKIFE